MSLFGDSPPSSPGLRPNRSIFNDVDPVSRMGAVSLFADLDADNIASDLGASSPSLWASTTTSTSPAPAAGIPSRTRPRTKSRAEVIRSLLPSATSSILGPVPAEYDELWLQIQRAEAQRGGGESSEEITMLNEGAVDRVLDDAMIEGANRQIIRDLVVPEGGDPLVSRGEFNALLALVGLAQSGERPSLEAVDRQRNDLPVPRFLDPILKNTEELRAKPPQKLDTSESAQEQTTAEPPYQSDIHSPGHSFSSGPNVSSRRSKMAAATMAAPLHEEAHIKYNDAEDPWASPDMHRGHDHIQSHVVETQSSVLGGDDDPTDRSPVPSSPIADNVSSPKSRVASPDPSASALFDNNISSNLVAGDSSNLFPVPDAASTTAIPSSAPSPFPVASTSPRSPTNAIRPSTLASPTSTWSYYDNGGFGEPVNPFGGTSTAAATRNSATTNRADQNLPPLPRSSARTAVEETVLVTLMPEKEGIFLFQHHNYEVVSSRRGSKVIRRYSDFVWLLNCLQKRYPFRALPMLPPKRVALNGNHLSNDGAFIEKRRRGLARFLNAIVRHPVLSLDQLVIMFLTVPTELSVWRKQATISVQDEFTGRKLPPGLEDSLPIAALEELFSRTHLGIRRSADLYIGVCNIMDRLVKRTEGVAADHARIAISLISLTETNADVYATDTSDVPQVNDGLQAMSRHLRACQTLLEDESRAWEAGVLEDLKKQRDALVSMRDMFERRDLLDKDNIPALEKRINMNKSKIDVIRQKNESAAKYEELEKLAEAIHQDKQSIVDQHNRSVFVRECIRDELRYFQVTQYHVTRWNQDWAQERVKYAEILADNWRSLIDGLEGMPLGE
ncbi:Sorting nexin mvp1 [Ceratocystis pirilliformis]|uniref:Sorting nexin MVP1 n=1 Tax=Ceratocystis pirilliformis TaxID=259994 RepID=A0ABR3YWR1_9PEZI